MIRVLFVVLLFTGFISSGMVFGQSISNKGKLFIIGGGHKPASLLKQMVREAGFKDTDYIMILPMSSGYPDKAIAEMRKSMSEIGIESCFGINFTNQLTTNDQKLDSVRKAKLIFISGGDQSKFMKVVSNTPLESAIKYALNNGSMIAGTSAGAAVMSKIMITGNQLKDTVYSATFKSIRKDNIITESGLGLLQNAIIDQHFLIRSRHNRLLTAILEYPKNIGIGIDESTALMVQGNECTIFGESQVLVYRRGRHFKMKSNLRFSANDIRLDIYVEGEKFNIKN
jgi:cyanophycinase